MNLDHGAGAIRNFMLYKEDLSGVGAMHRVAYVSFISFYYGYMLHLKRFSGGNMPFLSECRDFPVPLIPKGVVQIKRPGCFCKFIFSFNTVYSQF